MSLGLTQDLKVNAKMPATLSTRTKDTAALSAGLIARKGSAMPADATERDAPAFSPSPVPPKPKPPGARSAAVTFRVTAKDFLRLQLGAAQLEATPQDIIIAAINDYLDRSGVASADKCVCLRQAAQRLEHANRTD